MKNQLILIFGLLIISCKSDSNKVEFLGFAEQDTIFLYQDGNCHFVANRLVENLESGEVLSAKMSISTSNFHGPRETVLNKKNFYLSDTLNYDFRSGLSQIDTLAETFDTAPQYYSFYGGLDVYYANGDTINFLDTVTLVRINPLHNNRMEGLLIDDYRSGRWIEYYQMDHEQIIRKSQFENGLRQGADTVFRDNKIAIISNWSDGIRNGTCREYRHNYLYNEVNFLNGISTTYLRYFNYKGEVTDSVDLNFF